MLNPNINHLKRKGLTLTEVLASIFILAIGAISVLVLFPVAALKVRTALANENIALLASNGEGAFKSITRSAYTTNPKFNPLESFFSGANWKYVGNNVGIARAKVALIDPFYAGTTFEVSHELSIATTVGTSLINRQGIGSIFDDPDARRIFFSLNDLIEFETNGNPTVSFSRSQNYTCSFLLKQNPTTPPTYGLNVLVYQGRNVISGIPESITSMTLDNSLGEEVNKVGSSTIRILGKTPVVEDGRAIQPHAWLLVTNAGSEDLFDFYQIQTVTEKDGAVYFELNKKISNTSGNSLSGSCFWVDHLVGVFPKGNINLD